jgi:hypothetical protein
MVNITELKEKKMNINGCMLIEKCKTIVLDFDIMIV